MIALPSTPALLMVGVLILFAGGLINMVWGRKLPRQGDWLCGFGILALLVVTGLGWSIFVEQGFTSQTWLRGWIWPYEEPGSITLGILRDAMGLAFTTLTALVGGAALLSMGAHSRKHRTERFYAALAISTAGVALSWFSLTPWLALMGLAVSVFGGFLALGSRWEIAQEASLAVQFGRERSWGLVLALLGLCVLAGGRGSLSLINSSGAGSWLTQSANPNSDLLGAGLLFLGALVQLQPFPFLGWVLRSSGSPAPTRIILTQVFPAWAVFPLLLRLEPQFRELGVFPVLGWVGLVSALLASVAGVLSTEWRLSLGAWTSAGFSISLAALAFAGPSSALCLVAGVGLGASALASFASALDEGGSVSKTNHQRARWAKIGCGFAAAVGTGFIGSVGAGGGIRWITWVSSQPALLAVSVGVFFLFAFLGWKVMWSAIASKGSTQASWTTVLAPFLLILAALGIFWSGGITGGVIPGNPDRFIPSLLSLIFGAQVEAVGEDSAFVTASIVYWGALVLGVGVAFWTVGKRPDTWPKISRALPRFSAFVGSGYGVDGLLIRWINLLAKLGGWSQWFFDRKTWDEWVPGIFSTGLLRGASAVATADTRFSRLIGGVLRRPVEVPSKFLQLIQSGDVQWYLFFAVGSGIAILAYFLRT